MSYHMKQIRMHFFVFPIIIAAAIAFLGWVYVQYMPWEHGYRVGTSEYAGHAYADQLKNADECGVNPDVASDKEFQKGCKAYFE